MKQSGQSRSLAASETRSNAKKRRTDSRVAKIDVESKKNSARGAVEGAGNKPIVGFSFSKNREKEKLSFEKIAKETAIAKTHN